MENASGMKDAPVDAPITSCSSKGWTNHSSQIGAHEMAFFFSSLLRLSFRTQDVLLCDLKCTVKVSVTSKSVMGFLFVMEFLYCLYYCPVMVEKKKVTISFSFLASHV